MYSVKKPRTPRRDPDHFRGCLLGGAIGDALGYPVEFMSRQQINDSYGPPGINILPQPALISDDTQMTMFTAEGLLRATVRINERGGCHPPSVVHQSYLRWLYTQGEENQALAHTFSKDGWLLQHKELHHRRAPGMTCLSALQAPRMGTMETPLNKSKGCGGVMRVAPVGLIDDDPFRRAGQIAAITHGHPTGYLAAGVLAALISELMAGMELGEAVQSAVRQLKTYAHHQETLRCIELALELLDNDGDLESDIRCIGQGWVAEEALAIGIYCALASDCDFRTGISLAVNHDGDSDSTGAITGNILGAYLGARGIPADWLSHVQLSPQLTQLADDLLQGYQAGSEWRERYPG